jgi:hypothetical protein
MKRTLVLLVVVAASAATFVSSAQAAVITNDTSSAPWSGWVSCANGGAGELVNGTVEVHNLVTETTNTNVDSYQFQFQPHGTLTGQTTGDSYQLTGLSRGVYNDITQSGEYTLTYVNSYQLIGAGTASNLRIREVAHMTISDDEVVVHHDDFSVDCA